MRKMHKCIPFKLHSFRLMFYGFHLYANPRTTIVAQTEELLSGWHLAEDEVIVYLVTNSNSYRIDWDQVGAR